MSDPTLQSTPAQTGTTETTHWWCCDPNTAICGTDLTNAPEVEDDDVNCHVCTDLVNQPCPLCGATD